METKLKTLKEMENSEEYNPYFGRGIGYISFIKLRQEAIKWIKEFNKHPDKRHAFFRKYKFKLPSEIYEVVLIDWIKHFFNINEKDLKNGAK